MAGWSHSISRRRNYTPNTFWSLVLTFSNMQSCKVQSEVWSNLLMQNFTPWLALDWCILDICRQICCYRQPADFRGWCPMKMVLIFHSQKPSKTDEDGCWNMDQNGIQMDSTHCCILSTVWSIGFRSIGPVWFCCWVGAEGTKINSKFKFTKIYNLKSTSLQKHFESPTFLDFLWLFPGLQQLPEVIGGSYGFWGIWIFRT